MKMLHVILWIKNNKKVTQFNSLDHELKLFVDKKNLNSGKMENTLVHSHMKEILENGENQKIEIQTQYRSLPMTKTEVGLAP